MNKNLMTSLQQAELQGKTFKLVEEFRQLHGLDWLAIFNFLVSFAWGYARRQSTPNEEIENRMRAHCTSCELAFQRATSPALPFGGRG